MEIDAQLVINSLTGQVAGQAQRIAVLEAQVATLQGLLGQATADEGEKNEPEDD